MEFTGRYTGGTACEPRACGAFEARFVFSSDAVWIGIIKNGRMRIYGNPPRQVQALLMRGKNQTAWRGPVQEMTVPLPAAMPPQAVPASVDPTAGPRHLSGPPTGFPVAADPAPGGPPRMSITPRRFLDATEPAQAIVPDATTEVRLRRRPPRSVATQRSTQPMAFPPARWHKPSGVRVMKLPANPVFCRRNCRYLRLLPVFASVC
jgi:hypothetical protein